MHKKHETNKKYLCTPMVMLTPMRPVALNPCKLYGDGTGVFLPWNVSSRKPAKHLPPRIFTTLIKKSLLVKK